ncbi:hypothetical protein FY145_01145 [Agrobacterium tumefaciens]|uniref:hypothetical protein n=1 Tax=Agrobacterium tumefaciens TaxID=358 RepID=UPI0021D13928|nr:hypothetical protein [Agrobacterium tumefaciens]UXS69178.1 hypothetical protein FY146_01145 [Agrobacterium tumefaciens]UXS76841.1 hypothetical protein FY145_01145 [Agrobacterium tumefaciens]
MTEKPTDIIEVAEHFTVAFYQGETGHAREQFRNSVASLIEDERKRCASVARLLPLGPFQTADDAVKASETQAVIADAVERAGWTP